MEEGTQTKEKTQEEKIEEYCQNLFGKPSKDIKYLLVTNYMHQQLLDEELTRTGLYQWINVFKGEVKYPRDVEDYNAYDIIQVNMSAQDLHLVNTIREQLKPDSKTKIVLNNDYTTELWGMSFDYHPMMEREMQGAHMLFGTEYYQTTALSEISGKRCYVIPHPADVKRLKSLQELPKKNVISTIWRRYDKHTYIPALAVRNQGLTTQLIGYDKNLDNRTYLTTTLFDYCFQGTNYFDFCDQMRESKVVFNPFTFHSYDRSTVDCAAMGVAVVGSDRTQSMRVCYPHTCVDPYDVQTSRALIRRLLTDKDFYNLVVNTAKERVEFYNHLNSRERFLASLYDSVTTQEEEREKIRKISNEKTLGKDILKVIADEKNN